MIECVKYVINMENMFVVILVEIDKVFGEGGIV